MTSITFGRQLIDDKPIGAGVTVDADGPTAELVTRRTSPIISNPVAGEWTAALVQSPETDGEYERGLAIYTAKNEGPPEHVHPNYEERFEVIEGSFVFSINGRRRALAAGEQITVPRGIPHTFHNESTELASCVVETRPAGEIQDVIVTLSGLAHDGKLTPSGAPRFLQAIVMGSELADNTVFTSPPPFLQTVLSTVVAPIARRAGYRATYPKYLEPTYWTERVEQPD